MISAAILGMIVMVAAPPAAEVSRAVVDPYLTIQTALVRDSIEPLPIAAGAIVLAARALGATADRIEAAAAGLGAANDLADARRKFGTLSDAIDTYRKDQGLRWPEGVKQAYCPMVRKSWLQKEPRIANPYFGREMPTCGSFR
ncbi:MAG: hypothetical protein JWL71_1190 [Acidobacteria bacterium]|nr:hypothetical protein [Acidobacteriota bacterium]